MSTLTRRGPAIARISPRLRRLAAKAAQNRYRANTRLAYNLAWLFPGALVAPSSLTIVIGALTVPRIALFLVSAWSVRELWRKLTTGGYVPIASDLFVLLTAAWMLAALVIHDGAKALVGYGAAAAIEFALAYLLARVFFGTPSGFHQLVRVLRFVTAALVVTAILDTLSGRHLMWTIGRILSRGPIDEVAPRRFGLVRAEGSLEHPILLGVFFVVCILLIGHSAMRSTEKVLWIGVCMLGVLLPLSSAPLLSLNISVATILFLRLFARFPWRMIVLVATAAFTLVTFFAVVDAPLTTLIQNLTYDPQTGMFRVLIWQWAGFNIERSPWLGIGFADWIRSEEMPSSIDSLYLIQAIRHGLPALVLLVLSMLSTGITMPLRPQQRYPSERIAILRQGLAIAIFIVFFNAFTVHFWGATWIQLAIVLGARAGLTESIYLPPFARDDEPPLSAQVMHQPKRLGRSAARQAAPACERGLPVEPLKPARLPGVDKAAERPHVDIALNDLGRIAGDDRPGRDVLCHDAPGSDDALVTDPDARQDDAACADEAAPADPGVEIKASRDVVG